MIEKQILIKMIIKKYLANLKKRRKIIKESAIVKQTIKQNKSRCYCQVYSSKIYRKNFKQTQIKFGNKSNL